MQLRKLILSVLIACQSITFCFQPARTAQAFSSTEIDPTTALTVGNIEVSSYLVKKNFLQSLDAGFKPTNVQEIEIWLQDYANRIAIVSRAIDAGYGKDPQVIDLVERMERYQLSQSNGALYKHLITNGAIKIPSIDFTSDFAKRSLNILVLKKTNDTQTIVRKLQTSIGSGESLEPYQDILERNTVWSGWTTYPHLELNQYSLELCNKSIFPSEIIELNSGINQYLLVCTDARQVNKLHPITENLNQIKEQISHLEKSHAKRLRRIEALIESELELYDQNINKLVDFLSTSPNHNNTIELRGTQNIEHLKICSYKTKHARKSMTFLEFSEKFNSSFIREFPKDKEALLEKIAEIVTEDLDFELANNLNLRNIPKHKQDKTNFLYNQIYYFYSEQEIRPNITTTESSILDEYNKNPHKYKGILEIHGDWYYFKNIKLTHDALAQPSNLRSNPDQFEASLSPSKSFQLPQEDGQRKVIYQLASNGPPQTLYGPIEDEYGYALFDKRAIETPSTLPIEMVKSKIKIFLENEQLETQMKLIGLMANIEHGTTYKPSKTQISQKLWKEYVKYISSVKINTE